MSSSDNAISRTVKKEMPFLKEGSFSLSPAAEAFYDELSIRLEMFGDQIIEQAFRVYLESIIGDEQTAKLEEAANTFQYEAEHVLPDRQIVIFKDVIGPQGKTLINASFTENNAFHPLEDPTLIKLLDIISLHLSKQYYVLHNGFFPSEFDVVEGYYGDEADLGDKIICDADSDYERQLSYLINVSDSDIDFIPVDADTENPLSLHPGSCIVYPSNYTCSYKLKASEEKAKIVRFFRSSSPTKKK